MVGIVHTLVYPPWYTHHGTSFPPRYTLVYITRVQAGLHVYAAHQWDGDGTLGSTPRLITELRRREASLLPFL